MFRRRHHVSATAARQTVRQNRRGTATVEFAITAPIFIAIVLGIAEMSRGLDVSERLAAAVREGGRAAASDMSEKIPAGMTLNEKITQDIRNVLTASGIDGSRVNITITHADGTEAGQPFDLSDPENYLKYFKIEAQVDYSDVGILPNVMRDQRLVASVVFRMGRSSLSSD